MIRHGKLPVRRPWVSGVLAGAAALAVLLVSGTSIAAIAVASISDRVQTVSLDPGVSGSASPTAATFEGAADIVIVGSDSRADQTEGVDEGDPGTLNNDVTMVVHISADHAQMTAVSIPRDLVTTLPSCRNTDTGAIEPEERGMFNEALERGGADGGLACVTRSVQQLLGITPGYAGLIKFDGVAQMADAVGGVTVCVATAIHDPYVGLDLDAGEHLLTGRDASRYLRSRHGTVDGSDLSRISNQQVFLSALVRKVTAPGGALSNPLTMYKLARAASANMTLSDSMRRVDTIVGLGGTLRGMDLSDVLFVQYPTIEDPLDRNRLVADDTAAPVLAAALQNDTRTTLDSGDDTTAAPSTGATTTPGSSGTAEATPTALPTGISGQSAADQTCAEGG